MERDISWTIRVTEEGANYMAEAADSMGTINLNIWGPEISGLPEIEGTVVLGFVASPEEYSLLMAYTGLLRNLNREEDQ